MAHFILTYHSHNINGTEYAGNDHVAFAQDLEVIREVGADVASLEEIAARIAAGEGDRKPCVGISFDDGPVFDFADFEHPRFGPQRGFLNIMRDFRASHGNDVLPKLCGTSFVIASPKARLCMQAEVDAYPAGWLADDWWGAAIASGFMDIGNHSWDHVHHAVPETAIGRPERDDFGMVDTFEGAEREIRAASTYIEKRTGKIAPLFAYPFGHTNSYLVEEYLPQHGPSFGLKAAFGTGGVARGRDSVWSIPRLVCGYDWRSPQELELLISG